MKLQFFLRYRSGYGQSLWLSGNIKSMGSSEPEKALAMTYLNEEFWIISLDIKKNDFKKNICYKYFVKNEDGSIFHDWENNRCIDASFDSFKEIFLTDTWNAAGAFENTFYTVPFTETLLRENFTKGKAKQVKNPTHVFKVKAPLLEKDEVMCLLGSGKKLGSWNEAKPILLERENNWWTASLDLSGTGFPCAYKYGIYNLQEKKFKHYEGGNNRLLIGDAASKKLTVVHDGFAHLTNTSWKGAGVAIPVFSLKSENSLGVGEFSDIKLLADWAASAGIKMIQLLPVNDTSSKFDRTDSYPYNAISAFALHPIYINLAAIEGVDVPTELKSIYKKGKELNALPALDYESVIKIKTEGLRKLYALLGNKCFETEAFKKFLDKNRSWLVPYAVFCYLRDENATTDFRIWKTYSTYVAKEIDVLSNLQDVAFYYFVQYHLHLQLKSAIAYAHQKGVVLKGDIPIGISRNSCDAWVNPELYNFHWQAGAPPDDFATEGQNWGFPIYNWEQMQKDGYAWWKERLMHLSNYFDAFRIDHILGFFRIWSIPQHAVQGIMGRFIPAKPVYVNEFGEKGIWFDYQRYCRPFITDEIIDLIFGENAVTVKNQFLTNNEWGSYNLIPEFETQKQVAQYFAQFETNEENKVLESGLYKLIANVILLEDEDAPGEQFHFRIAMDKTSSFENLIPHVQTRLMDLYQDYFYHRQDAHWYVSAMKKLPALKSATPMLICGEDLGMVPHCVPSVMQQLGILSLEVQRMPKDSGVEFLNPAHVPYLSVITPATHDMSTIREWWEEDENRTQRFYNDILNQQGAAPKTCEAWISSAIVLQHLYSSAMWCVFQLQDILGMNEDIRRENPKEERINIPADHKHYWQYRMHLTLESLISNKNFSEEIKDYLKQSGR